MPHLFENYQYMYWKNGKPIFAPNEFGRKLGAELCKKVLKAYPLDPFVYHFKDGSHVAALHLHRTNKYFCKTDLEKFFYSINRNRVKRALKEIGIPKPEYFARWSTVKNPFPVGGYALPYGFVQSPLIATVVLAHSQIGNFLRNLDKSITASVYMDDICLSGPDQAALQLALEGLIQAVGEAGLKLNDGKTVLPSDKIDIFNCRMEQGNTEVLQIRVDKFHQKPRTGNGLASFAAYCDIVKSHTWRVGAKRKLKKRAWYLTRKAGAKRPPKKAP